jgi:CubicO group peptidase (beta-lactamase class C family)
MRRVKDKKIVLLLLLLLNGTWVFSQVKIASTSYPADNTFSFASPESEQFSAKGLQDIFAFVKDKNVNIHSLLIIRHKHIVFETYFYPFRLNQLHDIASCTKSITSILIGIAIDKGFIKDEDQLVSGFFPEISAPAKGFETLTIKDLLTMTSGLNCGNSNEDSLFGYLFQSQNWADYIFHIPFANDPGKQFSYCSCNYYLLGEIIYRATKSSPEDFGKKYLFGPLGINDVYWTKNDKGVNYGWGDLALKPLDMAKIGLLLLDTGTWKGKRVISSNWLKKSTAMTNRFENGNGYGYGFWLDRGGAFNAAGRGGQKIHIDPVHQSILVATGGGYDWDDGGIGDLIKYAHHFDQVLKNDPLTDDALKKLERQAAIPVNSADSGINAVAGKAKLFNKTFFFPRNSLGIKNAEIVSANGGMFFNVTTVSGQTIKFPLGTRATYKFYTEPGSGHLFALKGYWKSGSEFEIELNKLSRINRFFIDFTTGDQIRVGITEPTQDINESFLVSTGQ